MSQLSELCDVIAAVKALMVSPMDRSEDMSGISSFLEDEILEVEGHAYPSAGPLVTLSQCSGSLSFCFSMRPWQARALAALLVAEADAIDPGGG